MPNKHFSLLECKLDIEKKEDSKEPKTWKEE